ncbi:MAG: class I SAM-dependent methyltransferase [Gelidibacter sp.]
MLLKGTPFDNVTIQELAEQIEAKKRCQKKLPAWFTASNIYYPNKLNIEQTSSELTAAYKANLISGKTVIDTTGGFGVDAFYFSKHFDNVTHCELNPELSQIAAHNYQQLNVSNIQTLAVDGIAFILNHKATFDWIYIDPSRRHDSKGKVFFLKDCLPNVPEYLDDLFAHSNNILIKTSPLLDFSVGINELNHVKSIHVVAVNNEVKELLWVLENNFKGDIEIKTANIKSEAIEKFDFYLTQEANSESDFSEPLAYLFEPNAAILKSGGFDSITQTFNVKKLHKHSHLYTSDVFIDFPGRCFEIETVFLYNKKALKYFGIKKANITVRNFPESVQQIRKKLNIKDGGSTYLFFTTNLKNEKIGMLCKKSHF